MGVCYHIIVRSSKVAFELGKNSGTEIFAKPLPTTLEAFQAAWREEQLDHLEKTPNAFEDLCVQARLFNPREKWVFVPEFGKYIQRIPGGTLKQRVEEHKRVIAACAETANKVWAFIHEPRVLGREIEVISDTGDSPWWDEIGWWCIGSVYTAEPYRLGGGR